MTPGAGILLAGAGFLAGAVNAVAGGGSLISFPALLASGMPSVPANVTNTVALWPGYLGGAFGYRRVLRRLGRRLLVFALISIAGAVVGAVVLLNTPGVVFTSVVPWLVLLGTILFATQPAISRQVRARSRADASHAGSTTGPATQGGVLAASVYGAYFGAGLGVMLLAVLGLFLDDDLQDLNAIKNSLSLSVNTVALVAFALFGPVDWAVVLVMALASLAGGIVGSVIAKRLHPSVLRVSVTVLGLAVTVKLFLDA